MSKGVAAVVAVAIVGVTLSAFVGARSSRRAARARPTLGATVLARRGYPKWVRNVALRLPKGFYFNWRGKYRHPRLASVAYRAGRTADTLTIVFDREVACGACSYPAGARAPRGTTLVVSYRARGHQMRGFSFG